MTNCIDLSPSGHYYQCRRIGKLKIALLALEMEVL